MARDPRSKLRCCLLRALIGAAGVGSLPASSTLVFADRPFFRPGRTVVAPAADPEAAPPVSLSTTISRKVPEAEPTPVPLTDAPAFAVPKLPELPPASEPVVPVPAAPSTTVLRPEGQSCAFLDLSTAYLNRLFSQPRDEAGPVNETILGARVQGEQTTRATVSYVTLDSDSVAKLDVVLDGETCTRTTAVTPQAAIDGKGRQRFSVHKSIEFDGAKFLTRTPGTQLEACQQNVRARTGASQIPVVNSIAETIALNQANLRQPAARREAAVRVTNRVTPTFNSQIDERLAAANVWLNELATRTPALHRFLTSGRWSSSAMGVSSQLASATPVSTLAPPARGGASLRVHEAFADSLSEATGLNGREIGVEDLRRWIGIVDEDLGGKRSDSLPEVPALSAPSSTMLKLAESRPLAFEFQNNEVRVVFRAGIRAGDGLELPVHRIVVGYAVRHTGEQIELMPLPVTVTDEGQSTLVSGAIEEAIRSRIASRLQPVTISSRAIPTLANGTQPRIADVTAGNGWLTIVLD